MNPNIDSSPQSLYRLRGIPGPGDVIGGKYVVESTCRRGGIALEVTAVPAYPQRVAGSRVEIRLLPPEWCGDAGIVARFLCDGQAAVPLAGEHVARVFDVGTMDGGAPYFVLEHFDGPRLDELLATWGTVPVPTAIDWILQAAEAVAEAHARGVVHGRLKISSLTLAQHTDGARTIKVRDFGLSRVIDAFSGYAEAGPEDAAHANRRLALDPDALRSVQYVAPEQLRAGTAIDERTDVWSLGAILHELIAGHPPFGGETVPSVCAAVLSADAPHLCALRANVPGAVDRAVHRCLNRDPAERYANLSALAHALVGSGTEIARAACDRIDRVLGVDRMGNDPIPLVARTGNLTARGTLRMVAGAAAIDYPEVPIDYRGARRADEPGAVAYDGEEGEEGEQDDVRAFQAPASGRIVALALVMLFAIGAAAFAGLYEAVHAPPSDVPGSLVVPASR